MYLHDNGGHTIANEGVEVQPVQDEPLVLEIRSPSREIAVRTAYLLAWFTRGEVMQAGSNEWESPEVLIPQMGSDFDLDVALERFWNSPFQNSSLENPYPNRQSAPE
jgi:hypothetical protein